MYFVPSSLRSTTSFSPHFVPFLSLLKVIFILISFGQKFGKSFKTTLFFYLSSDLSTYRSVLSLIQPDIELQRRLHNPILRKLKFLFMLTFCPSPLKNSSELDFPIPKIGRYSTESQHIHPHSFTPTDKTRSP